ncbi:ROK family protein [Aciditerrimonas ferrireducens]|uniref:ROK family protein n=1 Tax=Aciditerrimonas ferrireducens TaxID=667306 RepID=UPI002005CA1D|nr:ROK family protein [Aciditerrimonas ferrireducens]MCK4177331.1 ROK family protein [Aciditerrimonas ferrireducens]
MGEGPYWLGVDVGGTKLLGLALAEDGTAVASARRPVRPDHGGAQRLEDGVQAVLEDLLGQLGGPEGVRGAGLGLPGIVGADGRLRRAPNLQAAEGVPVLDLLERALGAVGVRDAEVAADNDATCATLAEWRFGAARGASDVVVVTVGTGIGAGLVVGGRLARGARGAAGEAGHQVVHAGGRRCPCGRRGCWERYASGTALGWMARRAARAGRLPGPLAAAGGRPERVTGELVGAAATAGDPDALALVDELGRWLAIGVANLAEVLDCALVVLGGGVVAIGEPLLAAVRRHLRDPLVAGEGRLDVEVVAAAVGPLAGALGAAALPREQRAAEPA